MIPLRYVEEWRELAAWATYAQTEQDLLIVRTLIEMFSDDFLRNSLAFRGGTALHKLYLPPQIRYSEDIDLVQINSEPINPVLKRIRERLTFLGTKRTVKQHIHNNTIVYHFDTETMPVVNMRLKIEINTREHFNVLGLKPLSFKLENGWYSGECNLTVFELEELLGTKLRALYQRRKGRDLFDLYWALKNTNVDTAKVLRCYRQYMAFSTEHPPTQKQYLANMEEKMSLKEFTDDIYSILKKGVEYDNQAAWELVRTKLVEQL
jgi:predicted nucleotidyltransferase component of viral defense system